MKLSQLLVVISAIVLAGWGWIASDAPVPQADRKIVVPNLIGKTADQAIAVCKAAGFVLPAEQSTAGCDSRDQQKVADGTVACQNPDAGATVGDHMLITFGVYHTPVRHAIGGPDTESLIGKSVADAKKQLAEWKYTGNIVLRMIDGDRRCPKADQVCEIEPGSFGLNEEITMFVSRELKISAPPP